MVFGRVRALSRSGLLRPGSPAATARQLTALARWGNTLAGSTAAAAARDPRRAALVDERGTLSYEEFDARTNRLARGLADVPRVGLLCRNHRELAETLVACSKLGVRPVLLDPGALARDDARLAPALQRVDALVSDAEFGGLLGAVPARVRRIDAAALPYDRDSRALRPTRKGRTDGAEPLTAVLSRIPLKVHETTLVGSPLFHAWGRAALLLALGLRSTVVLTRRTDAAGTLATVEKHRCTSLFTEPELLAAAIAIDPALRGSFDLSSLRITAAQGGTLPAGLAPEFMDVFGEILYTVYGAALSIATPPELLDRPDTAGRPVTRLKVVREDGRAALPNMPGVIVADSAPVGIGHLDAQGRLFVAEGVTVRDWLRRQAGRFTVPRELPAF